MKALLALLLLCLFGCSRPCNEKPQLSSINLVDQNGMKQTIGSKERLKNFERVDFSKPQPYQKVLRVYTPLPTGSIPAVVTSYYPSGQIKQLLQIVSGRALGAYKEWYENGTLKIAAEVVGGLPELSAAGEKSWIFNGLSQAFDEEGHLQAKLFYNRGLLEGVACTYAPTGQVKESFTYHKGVLHGPSKKWQDDNNLLSEEIYVQGTLQKAHYYNQPEEVGAAVQEGEGLRFVPLDDGYRLEEVHKGKIKGAIKIYKNKALIHEFCLKNGKKEGTESFYNKEGIAFLQVPYVEGRIQGEVMTRYPNGEIESVREMAGNSKNGLLRVWYQGGQIMLVEEYANDRLESGSYYKLGASSAVSEVKLGRGTATLFDASGHLERKINYLDGQPIY